METQYYTLIEKQDFYEIIENKYGELAIFIDARDGTPENPVFEFDGKKTALLKRDAHLAVRLDDIHEDTVAPLAEAEFLMIVELKGKWWREFTAFRSKTLRRLFLKDIKPVPTNWSKPKAKTNC